MQQWETYCIVQQRMNVIINIYPIRWWRISRFIQSSQCNIRRGRRPSRIFLWRDWINLDICHHRIRINILSPTIFYVDELNTSSKMSSCIVFFWIISNNAANFSCSSTPCLYSCLLLAESEMSRKYWKLKFWKKSISKRSLGLISDPSFTFPVSFLILEIYLIVVESFLSHPYPRRNFLKKFPISSNSL